MTAVLVTGMSGVGKSTVLAELGRRGLEVVDTDDESWLQVVDGEPLWRLPLVEGLLSRERAVPLVVQGTVANQGRLYHRFDAVVLLTAPLDVLLERLATRTTSTFGRTRAQRAQVRRDVVEVEPLLRAGASHVVDTTAPLEEVVEALLRVVAGRPS